MLPEIEKILKAYRVYLTMNHENKIWKYYIIHQDYDEYTTLAESETIENLSNEFYKWVENNTHFAIKISTGLK